MDHLTGRHLGNAMPKTILVKCDVAGMAGTPEGRSWRAMLHRCYNPNNNRYKHYGARGITVCDRWRNSFSAFYEDMGSKPTLGHTVERLNNDLPYSPSNCVWATAKEQANNSRHNVWLVFQGQRKTMKQWSEYVGLPYKLVHWRLKHGWSIKDALTKGYFVGCNSRGQCAQL